MVTAEKTQAHWTVTHRISLINGGKASEVLKMCVFKNVKPNSLMKALSDEKFNADLRSYQTAGSSNTKEIQVIAMWCHTGSS